MADVLTAKYFVTDEKVQDGQHVLHSENCQVCPEQGVIALGEHDGCKPAMAAAQDQADPVNGCAFCCPDCYTGSEAFEAGEGL